MWNAKCVAFTASLGFRVIWRTCLSLRLSLRPPNPSEPSSRPPCRTKYGEAASHQLLQETQKRNPTFYKLVIADLLATMAKITHSADPDPQASPVPTPAGGTGGSGSGGGGEVKAPTGSDRPAGETAVEVKPQAQPSPSPSPSPSPPSPSPSPSPSPDLQPGGKSLDSLAAGPDLSEGRFSNRRRLMAGERRGEGGRGVLDKGVQGWGM